MGKARIVVLGGQLGSALLQHLQQKRLQVVGLTHGEMDVRDAHLVHLKLSGLSPEWVINTAAFHNVGECERMPAMALAINAVGALTVALVCRDIGARCVYISTNYVFDGTKKDPYHEGDGVRPLQVYGISKAAGEFFTRGVDDSNVVIRTASLFGPHNPNQKGLNFVNQMLARAKSGAPIEVIDDQSVSPTYTPDLVLALANLIDNDAQGIYHVVNDGNISYYEFARAIVALAGYETPVLPGKTQGEPRRPANGSLCSHRLTPLRNWHQALSAYLATLT